MEKWKHKAMAVMLTAAMALSLFAAAAVAAGPEETALSAKLTEVFGHVDADGDADIAAFLGEIEDVLGERGNVNWLDTYGELSGAVWTKIEAKAGVNPGAVTEENVLAFALMLSTLSYDADFSALNELRGDPDFQQFYDDLVAKAGIGLSGLGDMEFADLFRFALDLDQAMRDTVADMPSFDSIADLVGFRADLIAAVNGVIGAKGTDTAKLLDAYGITAADLLDVRTNMMLDAVHFGHALDAELALAQAYHAMVNAAPGQDDDDDNGGSGGAGGGVPAGAVELPDEASDTARQKLEELKEALSDLPATEKKEQVKDARREVVKAIKETAKVKVEVEVSEGKAVPAIDANRLVDVARAVKAVADELNGELETVGGKKAKVELTLDLGTVEADAAKIELDKALLGQLAETGIDNVAITINGVEIAVNPAALPGGAVLNIAKRGQSDAAQVPAGAASDVYEFEFVSGGEAVSEFSTPVELRIPVGNAANYDTDLLTLAKIDGDTLIYYLGKYDPETGMVIGRRDSLSAYVVVENEVVFDDLAPVQSWAERYIRIAAAKGVIVGDGKGGFNPTADVTRAEFVKMLAATFGLTGSGATEIFTDVGDGDWYKPYVAAAAQAGIAEGRTARRFEPNAPITRQEMAYMTGRALLLYTDAGEVADAGAVLGAFADASDISDRYKSDIAVTVNEEVMVGAAGRLDPLGSATRAEAAVVIKKLIDLL